MRDERLASYVIGPDRVFFVTTIIWRNEWIGNYGSTESGIRDMTRHRDGKNHGDSAAWSKAIPFTLCQHNVWPLERGHSAVVGALKRGIEPDLVWDYLEAEHG